MKTNRPMVAARQQRGVALIVVLILLLIMTLLGLASLRGTLMEERMTSSLYDRSLSFQAAEAALRQGEELAAISTPDAVPGLGRLRRGPLPDPGRSGGDRACRWRPGRDLDP